MLIIDDLTRRFGPEVAVDRVSLAVPAGQVVGVIGPTAAGKSTLLRLINRLIDPSAGRILCDEVDVAKLNGPALRAWRSECAMIAAQFTLVGQLSATTNVLAGLLAVMPQWRSKAQIFTPRERGLALQALARVGMDHAARQPVAVLSQAGQRRVAIARALAQRPKLLLADDPLVGLDIPQATGVMAALRGINRQDGMTVICALSDPDVAMAACDRIIGMRDGRIVFDGAASTLGRKQLCNIYGGVAVDSLHLSEKLDLVSAA